LLRIYEAHQAARAKLAKRAAARAMRRRVVPVQSTARGSSQWSPRGFR
jgi:hypothetical protein